MLAWEPNTPPSLISVGLLVSVGLLEKEPNAFKNAFFGIGVCQNTKSSLFSPHLTLKTPSPAPLALPPPIGPCGCPGAADTEESRPPPPAGQWTGLARQRLCEPAKKSLGVTSTATKSRAQDDAVADCTGTAVAAVTGSPRALLSV